jgi:colanic acid/amylovoran biosynthesis protein WcaK/AmsJ
MIRTCPFLTAMTTIPVEPVEMKGTGGMGEINEPQPGADIFRACLFGASLDTGNMGCGALAASLVKLIAQYRPGAEISLLYARRSPGVEELDTGGGRKVKLSIINYRLSPKARLHEHLVWILLLALVYKFVPISSLRTRIKGSNPFLNCLSQADFVADIHGGDSFSDIYGFKRLFLGSVPDFIAILMRKKLVLLPQTYGPYKSRIARWVAKYIVAHSSGVFSRDDEGFKVLRKLLGKKAEQVAIKFCPDVAFSLEPREPQQIDINPPLKPDDASTLVGINVSGLLFIGGYSGDNMFGLNCSYPDFIRDLFENLLADAGVHILLVPHVFGAYASDDLKACIKALELVPENCRDRVHVVTRKYDQNEIKYIIGGCDFFIGSRMHACIAALSQYIPCVGLAYSRKFVGVFDSFGMGDMVLDARQLSTVELLSGCMERFNSRDDATLTLKREMPKIRKQLEDCFSNEILGSTRNGT